MVQNGFSFWDLMYFYEKIKDLTKGNILFPVQTKHFIQFQELLQVFSWFGNVTTFFYSKCTGEIYLIIQL